MDFIWLFVLQLIGKEGQLIITGHSLGGSVASLFTLYLLDSMDKKSKCRPICITFGSPLIGNFGLQHSHWNSFFLHVVSNKDPVPGLFLPSSSGRSPASSHSQPQPTTVHKPFGTYLFCSELGCACFDDPDLILKLLTVMSSSKVAAGGSQCVDYGEILRNLKNMAVGKGPHLVSERFPDPFSAGILMELETALGIDRARVHSFLPSSDISRMEVEARSLARKTKAFDAKKLNDVKKDMAQLEWYKKRSKDTNRGYYDSFKNEGHTRDVTINTFMGHLTTYWEDMVAQAERKPQKEGASFRTGWLFAGTTYRRMVEPLDIAMFYGDGGRDYINSGRSKHYQLLQQWYEEKVTKPPSKEELDSKRQKVSDLLTEDSCFWAHVEEAILSCQSLKNPNCTPEQKESSEGNLVKFGEYVMQQIDKYAVSPEIFLRESSFMKWWLLYEDLIETSFDRSRLADFMKSHSYRRYG